MAALNPVELRDVAKSYGDGPPVLTGVNLAARPGDLVALIGPSGCGKSTLLRLVAGLNPVSAGRLTVNGRAPGEAADELAFVFQEATLLPWLTVAQNVEVPLRLRGVPAEEREEARRKVLELVRLTDRAPAYPRQLSGGQKMRVSLARALIVSPRILLLDEPFGALDAQTRLGMQRWLLEVRAQTGSTVLFITHDVDEAIFLSDRILVMGPRPGAIVDELAVDLPRPRTLAMATAPAAVEAKRRILATLHGEAAT